MKFSFFVFIIGTMMACNNAESAKDKSASMNPSDDSTNNLNDTAKYYNIARFIEDEMKYVDLRNFTIVENRFNGLDSAKRVINKDEFLAAASLVLSQAQWFVDNKASFKETVFQDLGTESFTINYSSNTAAIKSIDLLLSEQTNLPKRLFIRLFKEVGDTAVTEQFSWIANKQFMIGRSVRTSDGFNKNTSSTIVWKN